MRLIPNLYREQRRIAEILSAADRKLELDRRRKEKLERVKKGLMNDLLIGTIQKFKSYKQDIPYYERNNRYGYYFLQRADSNTQKNNENARAERTG